MTLSINVGSNPSDSNYIISSQGQGSDAVFAQSIGGGGLIDITTVGLNGGNFTVLATMGGSAPSNTSDASVSVNSSGAIITNGALADGILAQSIGGGGGSLGISHERVAATGLAYLSATLGSPTQPSDTTAGAVNVTVNSGSDINTYGFGSSAVTAQSIGNGGGLLAYLVSSNTAPIASQSSGDVQLGSNTLYHGYGGDVSILFNTGANTWGNHAPALIAQSIGNGGGRVVGSDQITLNTYLGASLYGGYGGNVTVTSHGPIGINGQYSPAIIAQSIGGGGGFVSQSIGTVTFGGASHWHGNGGDVTVTNNAAIYTYADLSPGIVAMSIGGGGFAITSGAQTINANNGVGDSEKVTVNVNNSITTSGIASHGVIAMSLAGSGGLTVSPYDGVYAHGGNGTGSAGSVHVTVAKGVSITTTGSMRGAYGVHQLAIPPLLLNQEQE